MISSFIYMRSASCFLLLICCTETGAPRRYPIFSWGLYGHQTAVFILVVFDWWPNNFRSGLMLFLFIHGFWSFTLVMHYIYRMPVYYFLADLMGFCRFGVESVFCASYIRSF